MSRYKCGNRECTDEELDTIEKLREGKLSAVDPKDGPAVDMSRLESGLRSIGDEIREAVENLPSHISEEIASRPVEFVDYEAFKQHRDSCPTCKASYDAELEEALPDLAERHGYTLAGAPAVKAPVGVGVPEVAIEPEPEPAPDPDEEISLLDRIIPIKE